GLTPSGLEALTTHAAGRDYDQGRSLVVVIELLLRQRQRQRLYALLNKLLISYLAPSGRRGAP
ncbi:MAG: hypothetical protein JZU52_15380, partial [Lamprocystis purpurea]|nr:hypothetical protein [Lamprocystis purpurea]